MVLKKCFSIVTIIVLFLTLAACFGEAENTDTPENSLHGAWILVNTTNTNAGMASMIPTEIEFFSGGIGRALHKDFPERALQGGFKWTAENGRLTMEQSGNLQILDYEISEETLTILYDRRASLSSLYMSQTYVDQLYSQAEEALSKGDYETASKNYQTLGIFSDAKQKLALTLNSSAYAEAEAALSRDDYEIAITKFQSLGGFRDARDRLSFARNSLVYAQAEAALSRGDYETAIATFKSLGNFKNANSRSSQILENIYAEANAALSKGDYKIAITKFQILGDFRDAKARIFQATKSDVIAAISKKTGSAVSWQELTNGVLSHLISVSDYHTVGLRSDGTIVATGSNRDGQCNVSDWRNIVAVSVRSGGTIGLRADGTVVAVGHNRYGESNVSGWRNIIAVSSEMYHTIGLRADGTVVAVGWNKESQCNVSDWKNIVAVSTESHQTVGLGADGTVVAVGNNNDGECNVSDWRNIVSVSTESHHTVGVRADGTVVAVGNNNDGKCNISSWRNIVAVSTGFSQTVGLRTDGTVVAVGFNKDGRCNVSAWRDIVAISTGSYHTVGLRADGTVVATGDNRYGECNVSGWRDIIAVSAGMEYTVGLRVDGTVVAIGNNKNGKLNMSGWKIDWQKIVLDQADRKMAVYAQAEEALSKGNYEIAITNFRVLGSFRDAKSKLSQTIGLSNPRLYPEAEAAISKGDYETAINNFRRLNDFKKLQQLMDDIYSQAEAAISSGDYGTAYKNFHTLGDFRDAKARISQITIPFGGYEWRMLDVQGHKALIITKDIVERYHYNEKHTDLTWESCTLRSYLNGEIYSKFSKEEQSRIIETRINNPNNSQYRTNGGNDTNDKIFLLSIGEANKYFRSDSERIANYNGSASEWWLRSPGNNSIGVRAAVIFSDGKVNADGRNVPVDLGIRPALWIDLSIHIYKEAEAALSKGDYETAIKKFQELDDFRDSKAKLSQAIELNNSQIYTQAEAALSKSDFETAIRNFQSLGDFHDARARLSQITIQFGGYDWCVLDVQGDKALIIAQDIVEIRPYNEQSTNITWETCSLRRYLNGEFLQKFSKEEQAQIVETKIYNPDNLWYGTKGGNDTTDKIFLLSLEEVDKYFGDSGDYLNKRRVKYSARQYPNGKMVPANDGYGFSNENVGNRISKFKNEASWWWLRSPGQYHEAAGVLDVGFVYVTGCFVSFDFGGVRPALWIDLSLQIYAKAETDLHSFQVLDDFVVPPNLRIRGTMILERRLAAVLDIDGEPNGKIYKVGDKFADNNGRITRITKGRITVVFKNKEFVYTIEESIGKPVEKR